MSPKPLTPNHDRAEVEQDNGTVVGEHRVFDVVRHQVTWRKGQRDERFPAFTLRMPNWTTVVAIDHQGRAVLVRQHRYGVACDMLETPGGVVDPHEQPQQAAARELREETGYRGDDWQSLGWVHPNPALQGNRIYLWLARDVTHDGQPNLDDHEEVETILLPTAELQQALRDGAIRHALSALALERALHLL